MKALFNCRPTNFSLPSVWQGSAYLLPMANKPLIEYWLDLCVCLGITELMIIEYQENREIHSHLRTGAEWGLQIQYAPAHIDDVLPDILSSQASFLDQDTLVIDGLLFPFYDRHAFKDAQESPSDQIVYCLDRKDLRLNDTCLIFPQAVIQKLVTAQNDADRFQHWTGLSLDQHPKVQFSILTPKSLKDYYLLSLKVLESHQQFYMKGFEVAPGVFEGINNEIEQRPSLCGPTILGQFCQLGPEVRLERTILNDHVRVEGKTHLKDCLVWGPIYLADVQLEKRLIFPGQCLDPLNGQSLSLEIPWRLKQLLEDVESYQVLLNDNSKIVTRLLISRWPLYQLLRWSVPVSLQKYYLNANGESFVVSHYERPSHPNPLQALFFRLGLQYVPLLLMVREQRLLLVGTRLLPTGTEYLRYMQQLPVYAPGVFNSSADLTLGSLEHLMSELHYCSQVDERMNQHILEQFL